MICSSHNDQDWKRDPGVYKRSEWTKITFGKRVRTCLFIVLMVIGYPICLRGLRSAFQRVVCNKNVVEEFEDWTSTICVLAKIVVANEVQQELRWSSANTVRNFVNIR